ncbi:MAG: IS1595 family transposase, partial [candidate division NC10 bacterium]|nr:IS1595 family transposase [candidate division NC10 bacterium]
MRYVPPKFSTLQEMSAIDVGRLTEDEARTILENILWPDGPVCPHCKSRNATRIATKSMKVRDGLLQCNECRGQFTVTVGTVMHRSHITLRQWVQAFHAMCASKKGVSALQLQRNLGLKSYQAAWHLAHRVRFAMRVMPLKAVLKGTVEVDETYIGGKSRLGKRGRGSERKTPV